MKEKYNFKIDSSNKTVSISVSSLIFPKPVILRAAYHFIEEGKVVVEGDDKMITVTIIPDRAAEPDLEELAYEFNIQLISSFVEDEESKKHVGARETMLRAALLSPQKPLSSKPVAERIFPPKNYPKKES